MPPPLTRFDEDLPHHDRAQPRSDRDFQLDRGRWAAEGEPVRQANGRSVFWVDHHFRVVRWTAASERLFRYGPGAALTTPLHHLLMTDASALSGVRAAVLAQGRWQDVGWRRRGDGTRFWGTTTIEAHSLLRRGVPGWTVTTRGLGTLQTEPEAAAARDAFRLQSLGRAAIGVAHDLGSILMAIDCFAGLLESDLPHREEASDVVRQLRDATQRGMRLSRDFLAIGERNGDESAVDVGSCVRRMERLLQALLPPRVRLVIRMGAGATLARASQRQVELILLNLVTNARDAIEGEGVVEVLVSSTGGRRDENRSVLLRVRDTGVGIPPEARDRVFDRFFTTKSSGTGLGLAMVLDAVRASEGRVELRSTPRVGTTFTVHFRQAATAPAVPVQPHLNPAARIAFCTLPGSLVVRPLEVLLRRKGFDVTHLEGGAGGAGPGPDLPAGTDLCIVEVERDGHVPADGTRHGVRALYLMPASGRERRSAREDVLALPCDPGEVLRTVARRLGVAELERAASIH